MMLHDMVSWTWTKQQEFHNTMQPIDVYKNIWDIVVMYFE